MDGSEWASGGRPKQDAAKLLPLVVFGAAEATALVLWPRIARGHWFFLDDWDYLARRKAGDLGDLFRPHNEHWSTIPVLVYRGLYWAVGLRSYLPYQLIVVTLHLTAAALLLAVMRRAGVRPWIATAAATLFVFFGSGGSDIVAAYQIGFTGGLALGLAQLLFADHDGPVDRRDSLALLAGLVGLMMSGVAVAMVIVVGIAVLLRRGWVPAVLQTVPLAATWLIWLIVIGHDSYSGERASPRAVLDFVLTALRAAYSAMGQLPGLGAILAVVLVVGLALASVDGARTRRRSRLAAPLALLAGSVIFLAVTAVGRASLLFGSPRADRYLYLVAAMTLPALAVAADALAARYSMLTPILIGLLVIGIPGNVDSLKKTERRQALAFAASRRKVETLAHDPLVRRVPRSLRVDGSGVTAGWLADGARRHRIPAPTAVSAQELASADFLLSFLQQRTRRSETVCRNSPVRLPTVVRLRRGDIIGVYVGPAGYRGVGVPLVLMPVGRVAAGTHVSFVPSDGGDVVVLRDVGPTRIGARIHSLAPASCVLKADSQGASPDSP